MAVSIDEFVNYLRVDPDEAESLHLHINAAKTKARSAGIPDFKNNAQYDLFIYALAAMYYDNRGFTFSGTNLGSVEANARRMINSFVLELRHAEDTEQDEYNGDD